MSQPASKLIDFKPYLRALERINPICLDGRVVRVIGLIIESIGPQASLGELCRIYRRNSTVPILAEVVGFRDNFVLLMPFGDLEGINPGAVVRATGSVLRVPAGDQLLGRIINGVGEAIDDKGAIPTDVTQPITSRSPHPLKRQLITEQILTGITAIDIFASCGKGQRLGIFAGSGVGKSVMLGMIARYSNATINVIGLIGERGREVREFIENDLGPEGLKRSVVVAVTSDEPALMKLKGAMAATAIAEYFRDQGHDVMLMLDSVTRVAMAQREIGLAVGEPPATKGYTPSVFAFLPKLLERAGAGERGSITGLYTILVEGDDFNEPVSDTVRSILDGHVTLSRRLAQRKQYPAVDVLDSISRVMINIVPDEHTDVCGDARRLMSAFRENEDLINIGAYTRGSSKEIDTAIARMPRLEELLRQNLSEGRRDFSADLSKLKAIIANEEIQIPAAEAPPTKGAPQNAATKRTDKS
jgi:flagellum-specific ATP synthase